MSDKSYKFPGFQCHKTWFYFLAWHRPESIWILNPHECNFMVSSSAFRLLFAQWCTIITETLLNIDLIVKLVPRMARPKALYNALVLVWWWWWWWFQLTGRKHPFLGHGVHHASPQTIEEYTIRTIHHRQAKYPMNFLACACWGVHCHSIQTWLLSEEMPFQCGWVDSKHQICVKMDGSKHARIPDKEWWAHICWVGNTTTGIDYSSRF